MEKEQFYKALAEILNVSREEISDDYVFPEESWDSISLMAAAACADEIYDVVIPVKELELCKDMASLMNLIEQKKEENDE